MKEANNHPKSHTGSTRSETQPLASALKRVRFNGWKVWQNRYPGKTPTHHGFVVRLLFEKNNLSPLCWVYKDCH
jgi:hypothetical protein